MRVVWTNTALRGIWRVYEYIHDFNPRAAAGLARALLEAGDSLITFLTVAAPSPARAYGSWSR